MILLKTFLTCVLYVLRLKKKLEQYARSPSWHRAVNSKSFSIETNYTVQEDRDPLGKDFLSLRDDDDDDDDDIDVDF